MHRIHDKLEQLKRGHRKRALRLLFVAVLSFFMPIVTVTSLLLPAYTEKKPVFCGIDDHEHTLACYADPNADLENEASWSAGLPSFSEELPLSERLVKTARSQLGYHESERNYIVLDDGSKACRTRYGTFAGEPYGLWGGAFVKFCMHYAGLTNAGYPQSKNSAELRQMLISEGVYEDHCTSPYHALPGDLVFFTGENAKLCVGIVYEANAATGDLYAVAGEQGGEVREIAIQFTEARLLGFGRLPESFRPAKPEVPAGTAYIIEETPSESLSGEENTKVAEKSAEEADEKTVFEDSEAETTAEKTGERGDKEASGTESFDARIAKNRENEETNQENEETNQETAENRIEKPDSGSEAVETSLTAPDFAEKQGDAGSVDLEMGEKEPEDSETDTRQEADAENSDAKEDREISEADDEKPGIGGKDTDEKEDREASETDDEKPGIGGKDTDVKEDREASETTEETFADDLNTPEMPHLCIGDTAYLGILYLPSVNLELPVAAEWSYAQLSTSPCRFYGSFFTDNLVLCGHNYASHFWELLDLPMGESVIFTAANGATFHYVVANREILAPDEVSRLLTKASPGDWSLTLVTCTPGGSSRCAVRCVRIKI